MIRSNEFGPKQSGVRVLRRFVTDDSFGGTNDEYLSIKDKWRCRIYARNGQMSREEQGIWYQTTHRVIGKLTGLTPELQRDDRLEETTYIRGQALVALYEVKGVDFPRRRNWTRRDPELIQADLVLLQPATIVVPAVESYTTSTTPTIVGQPSVSTTFPRLLNYYLPGVVTDTEALARWDVVVVSTTVSEAQIAELRAFNPNIIILAYLGGIYTYYYAGGVPDTNIAFWQGVWQAANAGDWWLLRTDGSHVSSSTNMWNIDVTANCKLDGSGKRYSSWFPQYVREQLFDAHPGLYDGVFFDNCFDSISYLNNAQPFGIDTDRNGIAEDSLTLGLLWSAGMAVMMNALRTELGDGRFILANGPNSYATIDGNMIEDFPRNFTASDTTALWDTWGVSGPYSLARNKSFYRQPLLNMVNAGAVANDTGNAEFERHKRLTFASALLFDALYSLDKSPSTHGDLWYQPEYDYELGAALGVALVLGTGIWMRSFEHGTVEVNPTGSVVDGIQPLDGRITVTA